MSWKVVPAEDRLEMCCYSSAAKILEAKYFMKVYITSMFWHITTTNQNISIINW